MKRLFIFLYFVSGYCFGSNDSLLLRRIKSAPVLETDLILPERKKMVKFAPSVRVVVVDYNDETGMLKAGNPFRNIIR